MTTPICYRDVDLLSYIVSAIKVNPPLPHIAEYSKPTLLHQGVTADFILNKSGLVENYKSKSLEEYHTGITHIKFNRSYVCRAQSVL